MIRSAAEFVELRDNDDPRATQDEADQAVWLEVITVHPEYKVWVVHNKTVPVAVLRRLASDADVEVRFAVAMKRKCPPDILRQLAADKDDTVRERVAWNAKTTHAILELMRDDPCREVAEVVATRLAAP